ncbi:hypothetical protein, partial [Sinorhizobium fredii]|uniref:hypothetical protein n=1 Tax=Rhizobium fredii TaxID=380 RepID=UPI00055FAA85
GFGVDGWGICSLSLGKIKFASSLLRLMPVLLKLWIEDMSGSFQVLAGHVERRSVSASEPCPFEAIDGQSDRRWKRASGKEGSLVVQGMDVVGVSFGMPFWCSCLIGVA